MRLVSGVAEAPESQPPAASQPFAQSQASWRDGRGRFIAGYPGPRLTTGEHSRLVRSGAATGQQHAVAAARQELRGELGEVGVIKGSLADAFVELDAVRCYLGDRLASEGPLTGKGRTRALLMAFLAVVDRQVRLAQALGVEPHRKVQSLQDVLAEYARRDEQQQARDEQDAERDGSDEPSDRRE